MASYASSSIQFLSFLPEKTDNIESCFPSTNTDLLAIPNISSSQIKEATEWQEEWLECS